jgi:hypothetical protein
LRGEHLDKGSGHGPGPLGEAGRGGLDGGEDGGVELLHAGVVDGGEQLPAIVEALVEVALGETGALGDGGHGRVRDAAFADDVEGGGDEAGAATGASLLRADAAVGADDSGHVRLC